VTVKQALAHAGEVLAANNIEDPLFESELLLRHALTLNRVELYLQLERPLAREEEQAFLSLVERRAGGEPAAYITGHREFYGLDFYVDPAVLIPRPESELLVDKTLELAHRHPSPSIAEVGTGSGAIAVSLALHLPGAVIYAVDISTDALIVALRNCRQHGVTDRIHLLQGDMLAPLPRPVDLVVANLPYVSESELGQSEALSFEPSIALDGGPDGLAEIRRLCHQVADKLRPGGSLLLEIGQGQDKAVTALLHDLFPFADIAVTPDLGGIDRVVTFTPRYLR